MCSFVFRYCSLGFFRLENNACQDIKQISKHSLIPHVAIGETIYHITSLSSKDMTRMVTDIKHLFVRKSIIIFWSKIDFNINNILTRIYLSYITLKGVLRTHETLVKFTSGLNYILSWMLFQTPYIFPFFSSCLNLQ